MPDQQLSNFKVFCPLVKVDFNKRMVYGRMTQEIPDGAKEIMDYASSKPFFQEWSNAAKARTALLPEGEQSLGNVREMHQPISSGKITEMEFNDQEKAIDIGTHIANDDSWNKVVKGVLTGFSIGGSYAKRWLDPHNPNLTRYTAAPVEVSLVDSPAVPTATFTMIKADGSSELHKLGEPLDMMGAESEPVPTIENPPAPTVAIIEDPFDGIKPVPTVADHFLAPNLIENDAQPANSPDVHPDMEVVKAFITAVNEFGALKRAADAEKERQEILLKSLGSRVGIARREGEPLTRMHEYSSSPDDYGDPANWSFPYDTPVRSQAAIAAFNKGQGRDKYSDREWHVLGRRIAGRANDHFGMRHQYQPVSKQITSEVLKEMELKKDSPEFMAQLKAGIGVAVDKLGSDPAACKDMLMQVLGSLDAADNSTPANIATAAVPPAGGGQGDGVGKAADAPSTPVAKAEEESSASDDVQKTLQAQIAQLTVLVGDLAKKIDAKPAEPPAPAAPAVPVQKNMPFGDLAGIVPPPQQSDVPPVIAALLSGDKDALQKAAVLAGSAERPDPEAVMELAKNYAAKSMQPLFTQMMIANGLGMIPNLPSSAQ